MRPYRKIIFPAIVLIAVSMTDCARQPVLMEFDGVSDTMVRDSMKFRDSTGLFFRPEESQGPVPSTNSTWLYLKSLGPNLYSPKQRSAIDNLRLSPDPTLADSHDYLGIREIIPGGNPSSTEVREMKESLQNLPSRQPNIGAEIGALWLYLDTLRMLRSYSADTQVPNEIRSRVAATASESLIESPYLLLRVAQLCNFLKLPMSAAAASALANISQDIVPAPVDSKSALDALAMIQQSKKLRHTPDFADNFRPQLKSAIGLARDDFIRSSLIDLAREVGDSQLVDEQEALIRMRISESTGLVSMERADLGSVEATYLFARLLESRFSEVLGEPARKLLLGIASNSNESPGRRLRSVAVLKRAGDLRWRQFSGLPETAARQLPSRVAEDSLPEYLDIIEPAFDINPEVPLRSLVEFSPGISENRQRLALAVLSRRYLFSNQSEIAEFFADLQKSLRKWLDGKASPFPRFVFAASALPGAGLVPADSAYLQSLGKKLSGMRGCKDSSVFYSASGSKSETCSIFLTLAARGVPNAIE